MNTHKVVSDRGVGMVEGLSKICTICGQDCAAKPRIKDVEGNYFCKPCLSERERGGSPARKPAGAGSNGAGKSNGAASAGSAFLDAAPSAHEALWSDVTAGTEPTQARDGTLLMPCQQCGTRMPTDAFLCTSCGFSPKRGKRLATKVTHEKDPAESKLANAALSRMGWGAHMGLATVGGVVGGAVASIPWIVVALIGYYIFWLGLIIGAGAGKGAAYLAGDHRGLMSGLIGGLAAAAVFLGAQYASFSIHIEAARTLALHTVSVSDDDVIDSVYYEVYEEFEREDRLTKKDIESDEYPKKVVREGDSRLARMTDSEKNARKSEMIDQQKRAINLELDSFKRDHFWDMGMKSVSVGNKAKSDKELLASASGVLLWVCFSASVLVGFGAGTGGKTR